jgi:glycosyltransferase involved in cell wall biosynthesis
LKVLLSAFACEPGRGSELEAGFRTLLAAGSRHDVWVLTLPRSIPALEDALRHHPRRSSIHLEPLGLDLLDSERLRPRGAVGFQLRYDRWQRLAGGRARALDDKIGFDLMHHVTVSSYWTRLGIGSTDKPLVWGPVGGGVDPPVRLLVSLGLRGASEAVARILVRPVIANLPPIHRSRRHVVVLLAQNEATARRIGGAGLVRVVSNALAVEPDGSLNEGERTRDLLFVGRLVAWKGPMLALRGLRELNDRRAVLRFCGIGPEQARLEKAARRWGLGRRVRFEGYLPREELLRLLAKAGALIHPALHEEAGLSVAEALSLGTPVVCLDRGGPAELVRQWPLTPAALIPPTTPEATALAIAAALDLFLAHAPPVRRVPLPPVMSYSEELLRAYELATRRTAV